MPYRIKDVRLKSEHYNNILNGDVEEYQNEIDDLKAKLNVSGSVVDSKQPLRDEQGRLVSFESSIDGISLEEDNQQVRLENKQQFFVGDIDNSFTHYFTDSDIEDDDEDDDTNTTEDTVLFQMTNRDFLIQFINEYFQEENTPDMSTDLLHERLRKFFKQEGTAGGDNPDGWVSFIQANDPKEERPVKKFTLKGKKKGKWYKKKKRSDRHNYSSLKKDIGTFRYDDVINEQLYFTRRGQEIWLKLDLPYVRDDDN